MKIGKNCHFRAIVDCLADSMEKSESKPGRLEVDTGNTVQKISLQKYITSECKCEVSGVKLFFSFRFGYIGSDVCFVFSCDIQFL